MSIQTLEKKVIQIFMGQKIGNISINIMQEMELHYATDFGLIRSGKILDGNSLSLYVMPRIESIDIDDELDFKTAEFCQPDLKWRRWH